MPHLPFNILPDPYKHSCHTHHLISCHTHLCWCPSSYTRMQSAPASCWHRPPGPQRTSHSNHHGNHHDTPSHQLQGTHTHTVMKHHNITHSLISSWSWIWKNFRMKFFQALSKLQLILTVDISFKTGQPYPKLISLALSLGLIPSFFFPTTSSYPLNSYLPLQMSPSFNSLASGMPWQITSFTDLKNTMTSQWHHTWNGATGIVKWWKIDWWMISESGAGEGEDRNGPDSP